MNLDKMVNQIIMSKNYVLWGAEGDIKRKDVKQGQTLCPFFLLRAGLTVILDKDIRD
jgi:hypothetical protein